MHVTYFFLFRSDPAARIRVDPIRIRTVANAQPQRVPTRLYSLAQNLWLQQKIKALVAAKRIERSRSEWSSPVHLVVKGSGWRLVIDYRKCNTQLLNSAWSIPKLDYLLECAIGA
eukprot:12785104-Prorocentrum_lima.AAC.1